MLVIELVVARPAVNLDQVLTPRAGARLPPAIIPALPFAVYGVHRLQYVANGVPLEMLAPMALQGAGALGRGGRRRCGGRGRPRVAQPRSLHGWGGRRRCSASCVVAIVLLPGFRGPAIRPAHPSAGLPPKRPPASGLVRGKTREVTKPMVARPTAPATRRSTLDTAPVRCRVPQRAEGDGCTSPHRTLSLCWRLQAIPKPSLGTSVAPRPRQGGGGA